MRQLKNLLNFIFFVLAFLVIDVELSFSQEYKYEYGLMGGTASYLGDVNKTNLFKNPSLSGGFVFRHNLSFRWAMKYNLVAGSIYGNSKNSNNHFPFDKEYSFSRTFFDLSAQVEFNFLPYSDKYSYSGTKPYTPYVFTGLGLTYATGGDDFFNINAPFGVGFKYKLKNRVNIGLEFSLRKFFVDDFDVVDSSETYTLDSPYGIESSRLKNQDWYSLTLLFLTWEFGLRKDPCR